jgi:hypothetical protein
VLDGTLGIRQPSFWRFELGQQHQVMPPWQLSNSLLDNFSIGPDSGKCAHVHQVDARKPLHIRERGTQIVPQPRNHLGTPALFGLSLQDVVPDLPVKQV